MIDKATLQEHIVNVGLICESKLDDGLARECAVTLRGIQRDIAQHVWHYGVNPDDRVQLSEAAETGNSTCDFAWTLDCLAMLFEKHWRTTKADDWEEMLAALYMKANEFLADYAHINMGDENTIRLRAERAEAQIAANKHQAPLRMANGKRTSKAQQRAMAARDAAGSDDLLVAACKGPNQELALVYGYDDAEAFLTEARYKNSKVRSRLKADQKLI